METRAHYEVVLFGMRNGYEDLMDWVDVDGHRDAVKKAKQQSRKGGITHTEVVKNIEFFYLDAPESVWDTKVESRWFYTNGKLTGTTEF